jgi:hypothetical protein
MKFFYSDTEPREPWRGGRMPDPCSAYLAHANNWFILKRHYALGTLPEKLQATRELAICERKLDFWYNKGDFDFKKIEEEIKSLASQWEIPFVPGTYTEQQRKWLRL